MTGSQWGSDVEIAEWAARDYAERLAAWAALLVPGRLEAAQALRRQVSGRRVAEARARDAAGNVRRAFAALRRSHHPLTGATELTLLSAAADAAAPFDALLTELGRTADADRAIALELSPPPELRAEVAALLEKHGFAVTQVGVRLDLDARGEPGERDDDIDLHPMRAEEVGFVRSCLATAVRRGLAGAECRVDLEDWIARNLALPPTPGALCLVACVDGIPVCHATGRLRTDDFTGERVIDVLDTFVLPEWKSRGLSRLATAALLDAAAADGARSAHSSVVADGGHERLLDALGAAGWQETGRQWRRA
jgi:hypothetical protein